MSVKNATNEITYKFPASFYEAHKTTMLDYLTKFKITHTVRKNADIYNLTIPADSERRFQLRMQLLKIKVKEYKK